MQASVNRGVVEIGLSDSTNQRLENSMQALGRHWIVEFWECNVAVNSPETVRRAMIESVDAIGATLLHLHVEQFEPQGITGLAVLAESHFSVHSWPEHGYLAADIFTCGTTAKPEKAVDVLRKHFEPAKVEVVELKRGVPPEVGTGMQLERRPNRNSHTVSNAEQSEELEST